MVRVIDLRRLDPMTRHRALEAAASQLLALVTLPFTHPGVPHPPEWTQLLGLAFLLASCVITLHTWSVIVGRVGHARSPMRADMRLQRQVVNERRLRRAALIYPIVTLVLIPLPPTWRWLWFTLTVISAVLGAIALYRLPRSLPG
ncbi:hypothetical protein AB0L82_09285 [Nocardia sp. NPDC052001]|uniref:hypothetical protein n=1 Tax=Nocardia sp. NPDC052001 TaxID=3154853 RepID=UPI00343A2415